MTRDIAALHADLRIYGAAVVGAPRTAVWVYSGGQMFFLFETTQQDSGHLLARSKA